MSSRAVSPGLVHRLLEREATLARWYSAALSVAMVETLLVAPTGSRLVACGIAVALPFVVFAMLGAMVSLQIVVNPLWGPITTRGFMSIIMVTAPMMVLVSLVVFPFAPPEVALFGNGAATGWVGVAWGSQFLYRRHGLGNAYSPMEFWRNVW